MHLEEHPGTMQPATMGEPSDSESEYELCSDDSITDGSLTKEGHVGHAAGTAGIPAASGARKLESSSSPPVSPDSSVAISTSVSPDAIVSMQGNVDRTYKNVLWFRQKSFTSPRTSGADVQSTGTSDGHYCSLRSPTETYSTLCNTPRKHCLWMRLCSTGNISNVLLLVIVALLGLTVYIGRTPVCCVTHSKVGTALPPDVVLDVTPEPELQLVKPRHDNMQECLSKRMHSCMHVTYHTVFNNTKVNVLLRNKLLNDSAMLTILGDGTWYLGLRLRPTVTNSSCVISLRQVVTRADAYLSWPCDAEICKERSFGMSPPYTVHQWEESGHKDIAILTGISNGTFASNIRRGKCLLTPLIFPWGEHMFQLLKQSPSKRILRGELFRQEEEGKYYTFQGPISWGGRQDYFHYKAIPGDCPGPAFLEGKHVEAGMLVDLTTIFLVPPGRAFDRRGQKLSVHMVGTCFT